MDIDPLDANRHYGKTKHTHKYVIELEWSIRWDHRNPSTYRYNIGKAKLEHEAEHLFNKAVRDRLRYGHGIIRLYEDGIIIKTTDVSELHT